MYIEYNGGILSGGFCPGGFCLGDFVLGGILSRGILSRGILSGGLCPGEFCPRTNETSHRKPKYIVFHNQLLLLLSICLTCFSKNEAITNVTCGSVLTAYIKCLSCKTVRVWKVNQRLQVHQWATFSSVEHSIFGIITKHISKMSQIY